MPVVLWQVARCIGAEEFAGGAEVLQPEEMEQLEVFAVRALMSLAVRALLRLEVCGQASWA